MELTFLEKETNLYWSFEIVNTTPIFLICFQKQTLTNFKVKDI